MIKNLEKRYIIKHWEDVVICSACGNSMFIIGVVGHPDVEEYCCMRCGNRKSVPISDPYDRMRTESIDEKEARMWQKAIDRIPSNIPTGIGFRRKR